MILENQICSLAQAEKLKALGVAQKSLFHFVNKWRNPRCQEINDGEMIIGEDERPEISRKGIERGTEVELVSAFTVAELIQMNGDVRGIMGSRGKYYCKKSSHEDSFSFIYKTFAQACADKLINAIELNLVDIEEVNLRLSNN